MACTFGSKKIVALFEHAIWRLLNFVHAMNIDEIRNIICVVYAHCMIKMKEPPYGMYLW